MSGSFVQRRIDVTFTRTSGTFTQSGTNTVTLSGLRTSAIISNVGGQAQGSLDLRIYGMTQTMMNDLTLVSGTPVNVNVGNVVTVAAGNDGAGLATVYQGTIAGSFADYTEAPNVSFRVLGIQTLDAALRSVPPSSYRGGADVAVIMANFAKLLGMPFENGGVSGIFLSNPYFSGSLLSQAEACRDAAGINMVIDRGRLAIWPKGGSRGGEIPLISPQTGLIGYPARTSTGVIFDTVFNPALNFGAKVQIESSVYQTSGTWVITQLNHRLDAMVPGGVWTSHVDTWPVGVLP
jgi:hypothetical protein